MTFLFENFLSDRVVYSDNVEYWKKLFEKILVGIKFEKFFNTTFANGEDFFDGNPIFNFKILNSNKAVFVVQEEPENTDVYFRAWIDDFITEDQTIEKLVIVLELSEKSEYMTIELVKKWILQGCSLNELKEYINSFSKILNGPGKNIFSEIFRTDRTGKIISNPNSSDIPNKIKLDNLLVA